ncbi:MAG TPA: ABC transporter ATP-binding protein [Clostridiales bacterium]|nr:ABC transporter ATP-binding protein [Clostridiales bacterium]
MKVKKQSTAALLFEFSRNGRYCFVLALIASSLSIIFSFLTPQIIRFTVDSVIGTEKADLPVIVVSILEALGEREFLRSHLYFCASGVVVCALISGIFNYISRMNIAKGTENFTKNLRDTLFRHIQYLPFSWHTENQTGDIIQRCTSDVETVRNFISAQLLEVIRTVILIVVALALMFSMNVTMALICLAFIPAIILYSTVFYGRIGRQFRKADEAEGDLMVAVQENLTGVRVVRAFGRERRERQVFKEKNEIFTNKWIDLGYTLGLFWGIGDFATGAQILAVVCAGAYLAASGRMTLGELLVFISYSHTLSWPVRSLGRTLSEFSKADVSIDRIRDILDAPAEPQEPDALTPDLHGDIRFKNVSFSYGGQKVLHDLNFTIEKGATVGILGATGSGKSTVTYLMNRLYEPDSGRITIGGIDIREIDRYYLRRNIGLVLQEPFLFSKTVRENIEIAAKRPDFERVRGAAGIAAVDDNISGFREGYDTIVGERGVTLSGGQKQRIAIARTLMMECPILVFDDSMSAVDMETDAKIRESLRENTRDATVILISHRINTLMQADKILVMDKGHIVQTGTHRELIAQEGIYRRVYRMQSDAGLIKDGGEDRE